MILSRAKTVAAYLKELPPERQEEKQHQKALEQQQRDDAQQQMVSAEGLARLQQENKSLRVSLLDPKNHNKKVVEALATPSRDSTPSTARIDCAYLFEDRDTQIVPLTFVIENGKLMLNSW
jgi:hypothetical protein